MGVSKAEVKLRRLLRAQVHQTNDAKLVHYVATMRNLLTELTGDPVHQDLATIPPAKAREYAHQVELVAEKLRGRGTAAQRVISDAEVTEIKPDEDPASPSSWNAAQSPRIDSRRGSPAPAASPPPQGLGSTTMRRRHRGDEAAGAERLAGEVPRVGAPLQTLIQRHRELQEGLTDEMVVLSAQLKESSMLMDYALRDTDKILDSTESAVEYSLASTNRANLRVGQLSSQSWKTSCLTWLLLFMVFGMFMFMVVLIRIT